MKSGAISVALSAAAAFVLAAGAPAEVQVSLEEALTSLLEAERSFARTSAETGIRSAFLGYLAEGAVVFRPAPAEGRPIYERMATDNPALLTWLPEVAEVSAGGGLGYTSGPYEMRKSGDETEPSGHGHYVSVWKRQANGEWKVLLDIGIAHQKPRSSPGGEVVRILPPSPASPGGEGPREPEKLQELAGADLGFARKASLWGCLVALKDAGTEDIRVYRPGFLPASGRERIKDVVGLELGRMTTDVEGTGIAVSGDLGFTYGTFSVTGISGGAAASSYLRIWRRHPTDGWRIALDIALPLSLS